MIVRIYSAKCIPTGKVYVGMTSKTVTHRWKQHVRHAVISQKHLLHKAIFKYGREAFEVSHVADCWDWEGGCETERRLIRQESCQVPHGYNTTAGGDGKGGYAVSAETRAKLSLAAKGRRYTDAQKQEMSLARRGKPWTAAVRTKMQKRRQPRPSDAVIAKFVAATKIRLANGPSPETRAKITAKLVGRVQSLASNAKRSASLMGHPVSLETRAKISAAQRSATQTRQPMEANP